MPILRRNTNITRASVTKSVSHFMAYCGFVRATRACHILNGSGPAIVGFVVPKGAHITFYETAAIGFSNQHSRNDAVGNGKTVVLTAYDQTGSRRHSESDFVDTVSEFDRIVIVAESENALPDAFDLVADGLISIGNAVPRDAIAAVRVCFRCEINEQQAKIVADAPLDKVALALRPGRNVSQAIAAIERLQAKPQVAKQSKEGPVLDDLYGLGEAGDWGRELAADFLDWKEGRIPWNDVDCGILASGPPGTGKTTYAKALAKTCNVHLVLGSIARWQASGHLGHMLKAMRSAFDEARKNAPAIVFLDEIDAVGNRENFSGENSNYSTQVVAALLECIDGAEGKEGVVVVGACNYPEKLDPALIRPGRLDRHIRFPYPDAEARQGILKYHLRADLEHTDLSTIVSRTVGRTGADLEQLVRDARRRARRCRRPIELTDLQKSLPPLVRIPDPLIHRSAVHEAGHVLVGISLGLSLVRVTLMDVYDPLGPELQDVGGALFRHESLTERTRQEFIDSICVGLGGLAAEEIMLGARGAGGGGGPGSDLHAATIDALRLEGSYGLGLGLAYLSSDSEKDLMFVLRTNPAVQERVNQLLDEQFSRASELLRHRRHELELLSLELQKKRVLTADEVREIVESQPRLALIDR